MKIPSVSKTALATIVATTMVASGVGTYAWREEHRQPLLEVFVFPLKQGQALFIRTPEDKRILIDGGGNNEVIRHISKILPFYSRRIDTIIATRDGSKQVSGLIDVVERFTVDQAIIPAVTTESLGLASSSDPAFLTFLSTLKSHSIRLVRAKAGESIPFGKKIEAKVLFPAPAESFDYSRASAPELALSIAYGKTGVVLLGDTSRKIQKHIASTTFAREDHASYLLSVSHGASPESISSELLEKIGPDYLVYAKTISYAAPKKSLAKTDATARRLKGMPDLQDVQRINIKETGVLRIVSDGTTMRVGNDGD